MIKMSSRTETSLTLNVGISLFSALPTQSSNRALAIVTTGGSQKIRERPNRVFKRDSGSSDI